MNTPEDLAVRDAVLDGMSGFKIVSADQTADYHAGYARGVRAVVHIRCGTVVGALPAVDFALGRLVQIACDHDCTAEALVYATAEGSLTAKRAIGLLHGSDAETCSPEYLRALVEMVSDVAAVADRKEEVADFLWATADTTGDRPRF